MNKNKIFTSAKKIFKSREELEQEELLDIEQQDIAQEIEQLRAEIKAFYLEHPDKDPSIPDKIYVKDMNELEEKITEHIPKKVVEDEIVIKNIIEQDGQEGSNPLDFSRMKEYDLPDEYRSQVFSPNIADDKTKAEGDTVEDYIDKKSDTDLVRELFRGELSRDMQSINEEEGENVEIEDVDDDIKEVKVDLTALKESLDQDLLQQLQEQRMEEEQDTELKNKIFTHQGFAKSNNYSFADKSGSVNSNQEENVNIEDQDNEDTKNMSDLLSKLLSEGKLEADLYNEENQEGSADVYIPGLNVEYEEDTDIKDDSLDIHNSIADENLKSSNEEEARENSDSNLSDLLSNLLSKDQNNTDKEQTAEEDSDTEDYHNRVFISSVKTDKRKAESVEHNIEDKQKGEMKEEHRVGEKAIFQEYGEKDDVEIEINLNNLIKDDSNINKENTEIVEEKQDNKSSALKNNGRLEDSLKSLINDDNGNLNSHLTEENLEEKELDQENGKDYLTELQNQKSETNEQLQQQLNSDEEKISVLNGPEIEKNVESDSFLKRVKETEGEEFEEKDNGNGQYNLENILNSLLDDSVNDIVKDNANEDTDKLEQVIESADDPGYVKVNELKNIKDQASAISLENSGKLLKETSSAKLDNIENILDSLSQVSGSDTPGVEEKEMLHEASLKQIEQDDETKFSDSQKKMHKKKADQIATVLTKKKKVEKRENIKNSTEKKIPDKKNDAENKTIATELVKTDQSIHAVKVLTEEKRQSLLARLFQKIKDMFRKKPKMEIISQEVVIDESNVYKSQEKETFINGLITGSVSGDNVTLNPLAVVKKDVIAQGKVLCLSGAAIMGKVNCESIIVEGTVFGEIEARGKVIIKNDALVLGNIYSSDVRITQGAMVQGDIFFKNPESKGK